MVAIFGSQFSNTFSSNLLTSRSVLECSIGSTGEVLSRTVLGECDLCHSCYNYSLWDGKGGRNVKYAAIPKNGTYLAA